MARLAARLSLARHQGFCGRADELALFAAALAAREPPFHILYVYGPDGIGKSTLLQQFVDCCSEHAIPAYLLDGSAIEPEPAAFLAALAQVVGAAAGADPCQALAERNQRQVLLIDGYEACAPLDDWLRTRLLPTLPDDMIVVVADCDAPVLAWRTDPGWQTLIHILPLRNLRPDESRAYLLLRGVPTDQHAAVLAFTHGHPLALALVADLFAQRQLLDFTPDAAPDMVRMLLERLVQRVPSPAHRAALEVCALVRITTEPLLAEMLKMPDVHELFAWLRGLSFVVASPQGVSPHALVREALAADVRWRNPDWHRELHRRARSYFVPRFQQAPPHEQQGILADYIFLHRTNPMVRPFFEWQQQNALLPDSLRADDGGELVALVAQHEGAASAALAQHWLTRCPEDVLVLRSSSGQVAGFLLLLALQTLDAAERQADPATQATWDYLAAHAPLRPGERATLFRFWMARDTYQAVSPVQSLLFIHMVRHYLNTSGLAFTFLPCAEPAFWADVFGYADLARLPGADFGVGGRHYGVYGHDWRSVPPTVWLEGLAVRETDPQPASPLPSAGAPLVVLNKADFLTAVRDALRNITNAPALRTSPLLRSRLVAGRAGGAANEAERLALLQRTLHEACEHLRATPQTLKLYRALYHTYLQPVATQERAAELLDLPFSTYRRHLKAGISQVALLLWQQEMGELPG